MDAKKVDDYVFSTTIIIIEEQKKRFYVHEYSILVLCLIEP